MSNWGLFRLGGSGLLLMLGAWLVACDTSVDSAAEATTDSAPTVRVAQIREAPGLEWQRFPGVLRSVDRASPAFLHPGSLASRRVAEGDRVTRGEVLASLHNPALAPAAAAARGRVEEVAAEIAQLERDLSRAQALLERELISEERVDQLESRLAATREARGQAEAALAEAQAQEAELQLRAPFDGRVVAVLAEPGDFLAAGQPVMRLAGVDGLEVEIRLPAALLDWLERDEAVRLSRPLQGGEFEGRLRRIGDGSQDMTTAVVATDEPSLAAGQVVQVHLGRRPAGGLELPLPAVVDPGGHAPYVWRLVEDGEQLSVEPVRIRPGRLRGDWIGIDPADAAGLAVGDRVVVAGQNRLVEGGTVRVLP
ncbi:efflux RND transporter periplasmic adaptor subunit [Natronospira sp.]|uniref:efflux RND transporter periplasmic adaptor subunit n=1 Tax=Natronospira sp. TaxID=2024970 RepID=UPI003872ADD9